MCKEFRMLVEQTDRRYVAQCEHDTVHLCWDNLTLSFQPEAFLKLGHQIIREHGMVSRMFPAIDTPNTATQNEKSTLHLRVNTVEVELPATELPELLMVLRLACALLEHAPATLSTTCCRALPNAPLAIQSCPKQNIFSLVDHLN